MITFKEFVSEKKLSDLPEGDKKGLLGWVNDYKKARKTDNVKLAKQIKSNIDKEIKKFKLNPDEVYGKSPEPEK